MAWHARVRGFKSLQLHQAQCGAAVANLPATDGARAGQGAGDAVHDLDVTRPPAGPADPDRAPAPWRGVVGPGEGLGHRHTSRSLSAWATWVSLPTSVWMSTWALSICADLLGVRCT